MLLLLLPPSLGVYAWLVLKKRCWPSLDTWFDLIQLSWRAKLELCDSYLRTLTHLQENADRLAVKANLLNFLSLSCVLCQAQKDSCSTELEHSFAWTSPGSAQSPQFQTFIISL